MVLKLFSSVLFSCIDIESVREQKPEEVTSFAKPDSDKRTIQHRSLLLSDLG